MQQAKNDSQEIWTTSVLNEMLRDIKTFKDYYPEQKDLDSSASKIEAEIEKLQEQYSKPL